MFSRTGIAIVVVGVNVGDDVMVGVAVFSGVGVWVGKTCVAVISTGSSPAVALPLQATKNEIPKRKKAIRV